MIACDILIGFYEILIISNKILLDSIQFYSFLSHVDLIVLQVFSIPLVLLPHSNGCSMIVHGNRIELY
jgi:hypothetical protein